jgi:hypothetical protein
MTADCKTEWSKGKRVDLSHPRYGRSDKRRRAVLDSPGLPGSRAERVTDRGWRAPALWVRCGKDRGFIGRPCDGFYDDRGER